MSWWMENSSVRVIIWKSFLREAAKKTNKYFHVCCGPVAAEAAANIKIIV